MADYQFIAAVPIELIKPNPKQPRKSFPEDALESLADSIREVGILQPILVRKMPHDSSYEIVAGERRWRAAQRAQLHEVPVIVMDCDDLTAITATMAENLQRSDLNPIEEASGYLLLQSEYGLEHDTIAKLCSVGEQQVRRERVTRMLRLFNLPAEIQRFVAEGKITYTQAEILMSEQVQCMPGLALSLAKKCVEQELSRRELLALVNAVHRPKASEGHKKKSIDWLSLESRITEYLGSPFSINQKGSKYQIVIECSGNDILDGVMRKLQLPTEED